MGEMEKTEGREKRSKQVVRTSSDTSFKFSPKILGIFSSSKNGSLQFKGKVLLKDCIITDGDTKGKKNAPLSSFSLCLCTHSSFSISHSFVCFASPSFSDQFPLLSFFISSLLTEPIPDIKNAFQLANMQKSGSKDIWICNSAKEKDLWTEDITKSIETMHTQDSTRFV